MCVCVEGYPFQAGKAPNFSLALDHSPSAGCCLSRALLWMDKIHSHHLMGNHSLCLSLSFSLCRTVGKPSTRGGVPRAHFRPSEVVRIKGRAGRLWQQARPNKIVETGAGFSLFVGTYRGAIIPGLLRWCRIASIIVHLQWKLSCAGSVVMKDLGTTRKLRKSLASAFPRILSRKQEAQGEHLGLEKNNG